MNQKKILVVEDDKILCDIHAQVLNRAGFLVEKAHSANDALDILESEEGIDAIISDVRMEDGDGELLLKETKRMQIDVPKIMISGYSEISEREMIALGASCFLEKPVKAAKLIQVLESLLCAKAG